MVYTAKEGLPFQRAAERLGFGLTRRRRRQYDRQQQTQPPTPTLRFHVQHHLILRVDLRSESRFPPTPAAVTDRRLKERNILGRTAGRSISFAAHLFEVGYDVAPSRAFWRFALRVARHL